MPSKTIKSAPRAASTSSHETRVRSITGRSDPLETTLSFFESSASRNTQVWVPSASAAATRGSRSINSRAVTSFMLGVSFAAKTTSAPPRRSSRHSGSIPSTTSAPALSTNKTHFFQGEGISRTTLSETSSETSPKASSSRAPTGDDVQASRNVSASSTHHGRRRKPARVASNPPFPSAWSAAEAAAPRSKTFPANTPLTSASIRAPGSPMASSSRSTPGSVASAFSFSSVLTSRKQSSNPSSRSARSRRRHSFRTVGAPSNSEAWSPEATRSRSAPKEAANRAASAAASATRGSLAARRENSGMDARNTSIHLSLPTRVVGSASAGGS
mmetsp:Transcript_880/g.3683  ORF Transcript_880/g.3683 Transcript_880/m.3683 type:complete len:329 (+) Transcript_880:208-1194(+)